jgi:crotonobetainyl-CoA:carnitine CoA-transferase CaiB-like acyl-CoA transferase
LGRDEWSDDPRFRANPLRVTNREALIPLIQEVFATRTTDKWMNLLKKNDVPHAPVLALDEVLEQPQVAAREMLHEVTDTAGRSYRLLGGAVHWEDEPTRRVTAPPMLGEHTDEVLSEWLGYDEARITPLRKAGAIE